MKTSMRSVLTALTFLCLAVVGPKAQAVVPAPDGGYPGGNTAEGQLALGSLTTGLYNNAVGIYSLLSLTTGSLNTATGAGTLLSNTADQNTATGAGALLNNTTGEGNTANGAFALFNNTTGEENTAVGRNTLFYNNAGKFNTATGYQALFNNTTGNYNTANGNAALVLNNIGTGNTAIGALALAFNTADGNTATGYLALEENTAGGGNTAVGSAALASNTTGGDNTALGNQAGSNVTGSGNVCIGAGVSGFAGESNITRIRNVYESVATDRAVYVTADGRIGTLSSSRRYKEEIEPMNQASERLFALKPVTFRYKKGIDPARLLSFGLIAEDVAEMSPELITRDKEGKPETVRYEAVNAMLLNEFLKEHRKGEQQDRKIEEQGARITEQQKQIQALIGIVKEQAAQIQKVSARLAVNKAVPKMTNE
jgi:hypothetical protein